MVAAMAYRDKEVVTAGAEELRRSEMAACSEAEPSLPMAIEKWVHVLFFRAED